MEKTPTIIKVGTFTKKGWPTEWHFGAGAGPDVLDIKSNGDVLIGGVLMVEMTELRKKIMGKKKSYTTIL